jgi:hypothetical protein
LEKKFLLITAGIIIVLTTFIAYWLLGRGRPNTTPIGTARAFVQALIEGDEKTVDLLNKSTRWGFPTDDVMSRFAPRFAGRNLREFLFRVKNEDVSVDDMIRVEVKSDDGTIWYSIGLKKIGDRYYFVSF